MRSTPLLPTLPILLWPGVEAPERFLCMAQIKQLYGEVSVMLEIWGMWSTPLFPALPISLWSRVVAPNRVQSTSPLELNNVFMLKGIA